MESLRKNHDRAGISQYKCIICGEYESTQEYTYHYDDNQSGILRCSNCGHLFIKPVPLVSLNDRTMVSIDDAEFGGSHFLKKLQKIFVIEKEIKKVKKCLSADQPALLDLGCGTGWTTAIWRDHGFRVTGLEPSESRRKIAQERHRLEVSDKHIENFTADQRFDVVVMRHLLEHIEDPNKVLAQIKSFLKPDGILLIIIPNINCIGRYIFKENWEWILPWHLHFYTPKTLEKLLVKSGYRKIEIYQMPSPLWYPRTLNKALFGANAKFKFPESVALILCLPIVFLGFIFNLNDNMTLIFRNKSPRQ